MSPAKLNLGLWILGKRPDGYHDILTVFHTIDLCDEIEIREGELKVETDTVIPQEENFVFKALKEFERVLGRSLRFGVFIKKKIPIGAGLGGGSSNVATTLKVVNELLGDPLSLEELHTIALKVSSDAPFFLMGGTALGSGRGEKLRRLPHPKLTFTILLPQVHASTKVVYGAVEEKDMGGMSEEELVNIVSKGRFERLENRLGEVACRVYPEIGEAVNFLRMLGLKPLVSGSGSAVFYIGDPFPEVEEEARVRGWKVIKTQSWLGV